MRIHLPKDHTSDGAFEESVGAESFKRYSRQDGNEYRYYTEWLIIYFEAEHDGLS